MHSSPFIHPVVIRPPIHKRVIFICVRFVYFAHTSVTTLFNSQSYYLISMICLQCGLNFQCFMFLCYVMKTFKFKSDQCCKSPYPCPIRYFNPLKGGPAHLRGVILSIFTVCFPSIYCYITQYSSQSTTPPTAPTA